MTLNAGRVAVVTGGGRGLGRAAALRLAGEGADVAVLARSADEIDKVAYEVEACGVRSLAVTVDVASADDVEEACSRIEKELGGVDILVNNAGNMLYKPLVPLPGLETFAPGFDLPTTDAEFEAVLDVHLFGAVRMLRAFGPGMLERRHGRVVNVVSNVVRRTVPFCLSYDTAKGALVQLTRSLAREWGPYGVTVNAIAAGHFHTSMSAAQFENDSIYKKMVKRIPVKRGGDLEEFAALVAYLSGEETGFVTGETIGIDGGETL
ncbi:gluconate 5-dehydrogenase/3-oxoacyl-[acyl-carrier protein] reductase [Jatrophihabitans sp. GAS493]|uniref:SDR family NAD(P)-dependent oxidoreductase n=1 Tax=Jatrophihabitans sp. GAS493 TaxID=1907575 RepID=UPI000BC07F57|nr:SDR family oxidoreductase [Jatrophihabitans sp. GAS493]SOD72117.1 gluconate 5-dehydrogenase/3-oxoacyl-[acyl-carrier protein] reductase [Jatrophihabitans sp. GAS493]